jgi:hypothetical protein
LDRERLYPRQRIGAAASARVAEMADLASSAGVVCDGCVNGGRSGTGRSREPTSLHNRFAVSAQLESGQQTAVLKVTLRRGDDR